MMPGASAPDSSWTPTGGRCCCSASTRSAALCCWMTGSGRSRRGGSRREWAGAGDDMSQHTIAVLPGDGVGPEVTAEAVRALVAAGEVAGHAFTLREYPMGGRAYRD